MTARPSPADEERITHHVYGCVDAFETSEIAETFNVNKYLDIVLPIIADIHARGKLPIICGGTNYYIEGILFKK
jgi:tRNA dimethylallyltransferase